MKKGNAKRIVAGFMSMTLVFTSVFFLLIKTDVFGATNSDGEKNPNPYVVDGTQKKMNVSVRDSGKYEYKEWDTGVDDDGNKLPNVPSAIGAKGSKTNPFVILEVVPEKAMQELTYYAGDQESGLPYDPAYMSAKFMMDQRSGNDNPTEFRFTNPNWNGSKKDSIVSNLRANLKSKPGAWLFNYKYNVFNFKNDVLDGASEIQQDDMYLLDCDKGSGTSNNQGNFDYKELYNIEYSEDDLLNVYPSSDEKPTIVDNGESYSYQERNSEGVHTVDVGGADKNLIALEGGTWTNGMYINGHILPIDEVTKYYTDDLIYLARAVLTAEEQASNKVPTKKDVEEFISSKLLNIDLDYNNIKADNGAPENTCKRSVAIKKYNLEWYVRSQKVWDEKDASGKSYSDTHGKNAQDVNNFDMTESGDFNGYDISEGVFSAAALDAGVYGRGVTTKYNRGLLGNRGADATNAHDGNNFSYPAYHHTNVDLTNKLNKEVSNYWKVQFRKYYIDRYEQLFTQYQLFNYLYMKKQSNDYSDPYMDKMIDILEIIFGTGGKSYKSLNDEAFKAEYGVDKATFRSAYRDYFKDFYNTGEYNDEIKKDKNGNNDYGGRDFYEKLYSLYNDYKNSNLSTLVEKNGEMFKKLTSEFEPLFIRSGVDKKALEDAYDWEFTMKTGISSERSYKSEPKGGYILAVKPGRGDMYLLSKDEVVAMGGQEKDILFTRDDIMNYYKESSNGDYVKYGANNYKKVLEGKYERYAPYPEGSSVDTRYSASGEVDQYGRYVRIGKNKYINIDYDQNYPGFCQVGDYYYAQKSDGAYVKLENGVFKRKDSIGKFYSKVSGRRATKDKRWVYVAAEWTLQGDYPSGTTNAKYMSGYLDDSRYTNGFASKSFVNSDNYWLAIYDRKNRKYHPYDETKKNYSAAAASISSEVANANVSEKMLKEMDKNVGGDSKADPTYNYYSRQRNSNVIDKYHLNIWKTLTNGKTNAQKEDIKNHQNLINGAQGDPIDHSAPWYGYNKGANEQKDWIYSLSGDDALTGFCMNFNTSDVYNQSVINGLSTNRKAVENKRFDSRSDNVVTVDGDQVVTETMKKYHFTYYGFGSNPVLKRNLWKFNSQEKCDDFHMKVIAVTPAEMNLISERAKEHNSFDAQYDSAGNLNVVLSDIGSNNTGKVAKGAEQNNVYLDLAERADMFYFHTSKTKGRNDATNISNIYDWYYDMVQRGGEKVTKDTANTFYDNDLEWDQVMKIIKRSSLPNGVSIPILFNLYVTVQSDECVTPNSASRNIGQSDTHMYLDKDNTYTCSGNMCNISKLYDIGIEFDLRQTKGSTIPLKNTNEKYVNGQYTGPSEEELYSKDNSKIDVKDIRVQRTFMSDIYDGIGQIEMNPEYNAHNSRVSHSAKNTGYIWADTDQDKPKGYSRKLCQKNDSNKQFERNALYLWNMYTFYPTDITYLSGRTLKNGTTGNGLEDTRLAFLEQGYLEKWFYSNELASDDINMRNGAKHYRIMYDDKGTGGVGLDQRLLYRLGANGIDDQNVYVLHNSDDYTDNVNHSTFVSGHSPDDGGDKPGDKHITDFFYNAFLIINSTGDEQFEICAEPRQKYYSILNKAVAPTDSGSEDSIMYDYFKQQKAVADKNDGKKIVGKSVKYKDDTLDKEISVLVSARTSTVDNEAVITKIKLRNSTDNTKKDILFYNNPDKQVGENEISSNSLVKRYENITALGQDKTKSMKNTVTYERKAPQLSGTISNPPTGFCVNANERVYFYVPVTLRQFYDGYDKIVFDAVYYKKDKKTDLLKELTYEHTINLEERDLFTLE